MLIPALGADFDRIKYGMNWWKKDSYFKIEDVLLSYHHGIKYPDIRKKIELPEDKSIKLWGDSGGFQQKIKEYEFNPKDVLKWQRQNCDVGFTLDFPLYRAGEDRGLVKELQRRTADNAIWALKQNSLYSRKDDWHMPLYCVLQGRDYRELEYIIKIVYQYLPKFDGLALGSLRSLSIVNFTKLFLSFFNTVKEPDMLPLHFFGISGKDHLRILHYFKLKVLENYNTEIDLTCDSATYAQGSINRRYETDMDTLFFGRKYVDDILYRLPCRCPVCKSVTEECETPQEAVVLLNQNGSRPGAIISMHNLFRFYNYDYQLSSFKSSKALRKFSTIGNEDTSLGACLNMINKYFRTGELPIKRIGKF